MRPSFSSNQRKKLSTSKIPSTPSSSSSPSSVTKNKLPQSHTSSLQEGRVRKLLRERQERRLAIAKLRRMLPQDPDVIRCSELELINYIMNYIVSLQEMLQSQNGVPNENHFPSFDIANLSRVLSQFHLCTTNRQPLRPTKQIYTR